MQIHVGFDGVGLTDSIPKTDRTGKGRSRLMLPDSYVLLDLETTGLSPEWDHIIEIGAIRFENSKETDRFQSLIQPPEGYDGKYIDDFITELTGITNEMLETAPKPDEVIPSFSGFLGDSMILGYNVGFDINFLFDAFMENLDRPLSNDYVDILRFARKLYPEMRHHRLCDMTVHFDIQYDQAHRSIADVEATEKCYEIMLKEIRSRYETDDEFLKLFRHHGGHNDLKAADIVGDASKIDTESPLYDRHCVFTGKLEKFSRKEAMQIVADLGGINEDSVTKKTNYLILGNNDYCATIKDGKSTKQKKAEALKLKGQDLEIVPETVFYDMLGDIEKGEAHD